MICKECGINFSIITHTHLKKHNLTINEYKNKYNIVSLVDPCFGQKMSMKLKGKINIGEKNASKRKEVRSKISESVKNRWEEGKYKNRINGMLGKLGELSPNFKIEKRTPLFLAEHNYVKFLSQFQDTHVCSLCKSSDKKINIHHIDEDHSNFLPSNLEPLCVPCHSQYHYKFAKGPFMRIGKFFSFAGAHFLPDYDGICNHLHGHEWKLEVFVKKRVNYKTGMVLDFTILKKIVDNFIISKLDHCFLNDIISNPTAENILIWIWEKLMFDGLLKGIDEINLWETEKSKISLSSKEMLSIFSNNIEEYILGEI